MGFSADLIDRINGIIEKHETKQSSIIAVLREVQKYYGWLSSESMQEVAEILELPPSNVQNVATFYTMFFTKQGGKHTIWLCRTLSCALRGAEHVEQHLCSKLGIHSGETTDDGNITLMEAECLASCGTAPAMLVDDTLYENLTKEKVDQIISILKED